MELKNGGASTTILESFQSHDIIPFSYKTKVSIFEKCAPLYRQGHSFGEVAKLTGYPKSTIRKTLVENKEPIRNSLTGVNIPKNRKSVKTAGQAPYGFTFFDGKMVADPRETLVLREMASMAKAGKSCQAIVDHLNGKNILSRTNRKWNKDVVRLILLRHKNKVKGVS